MLTLSLCEPNQRLKAVHDVTKLGYLEWCHIYCDFSVCFLDFSVVLANKCSFLCADLDRTIRPVLRKKTKPEGCCETCCTAVAHDCMTTIYLNQFFSAFSCGGFECHMEHFMNILSLNSRGNCHQERWQAVDRVYNGAQQCGSGSGNPVHFLHRDFDY